MDSADPQPPSQPFLAAFGVKLHRYRTLVRRHWWILVLTISIGLGYKGYKLATTPQRFQSESRLIIREEMAVDQMGTVRDGTGNFAGTTIEQLKSPGVLDGAYKRMALENPNLRGTVEISASIARGSSIFVVSGVGQTPEYTQLFVDAAVTSLFDVRAARITGITTDVKSNLADQIKTLDTELARGKKALADFIEKNNMAFWSEQGKSAAIFLSGLKNQQATMQNELQRLETLEPDQLLSMQNAPSAPPKSTGGQNLPQVQQPSFNSELYSQYIQKSQELSQKQAFIEERSLVWKPKHPRLIALQDEVKAIQLRIEVIKKQNVEATASRVADIRRELKSLESSIATWDAKVLEASRKDAEYQTLSSDVARTQSQQDKIIASLSGIAATKTPEPLSVMQKATPAVEVPRNVTRNLMMGLIGGLMVGLLVLFVLDRFDDRLNSSTELLKRFAEPILAQIPDVAESRKESGLPLLQLEDDRYTYAEALRSLRSSLIFMPNQSELKAILITSAIPNEGKSTIASNLAVTMAASGARVLLVDADLRRGDLAQLFDTDGRTGLSSILRGEVPWREAIQDTKYETLSLIARGPVTNQSGELLLKPTMLTILDEMKAEYDLVIFNTAPILATDDTPTLAPNFDGVLMVVRAQFTSARLTRNAIDALYQRQVNVLGLILNCVQEDTPDYYYYRYPKYYAA